MHFHILYFGELQFPIWLFTIPASANLARKSRLDMEEPIQKGFQFSLSNSVNIETLAGRRNLYSLMQDNRHNQDFHVTHIP
jgi:hypothetical protein